MLAAIFMIVMFLGFGGLPQLAVALQNRNVWFKHREANLYTASSYAWSMSLVQMPMSIVEALVFSSIIYFMVGFSTGAPPTAHTHPSRLIAREFDLVAF